MEVEVEEEDDEEEPGSGKMLMNEVVLKEVAKPPSMWDYSPRGLPKEFVGVDRSNFLVNPFNMNLCFLGKDILAKICSMLSPADFVNLSLTCRYLHWRFFAFYTCYVDYGGMEISDVPLSTTVDDGSKNIRNPINFTTETAYYLDYCDLEGAAVPYHDEHVGHRGVLVWHDKYLRKPFFFDKLYLNLNKGRLRKMPAVRSGSSQICPLPGGHLRLHVDRRSAIFFDYEMANKFFKDLQFNGIEFDHDNNIMANIFKNCPFARTMDCLDMDCTRLTKEDAALFLNREGIYRHPAEEVVRNTINEFLNGSANLDFHKYQDVRREDVEDTRLHAYLLTKWTILAEYYSTRSGYIWEVAAKQRTTGRIIKMKISERDTKISIYIGVQEHDNKATAVQNAMDRFWGGFWKMETAVEPDEKDKKADKKKDKKKKKKENKDRRAR